MRIASIVLCAVTAFECVADDEPLPLVPRPRSIVRTGGVYAPGIRSVDDLTVERSHDAAIPREGYRLSVTSNGVKCVSSDAAGEF